MGRILVVDDSASVFHFVRRELVSDGHDVDRLSTFVELAGYLGAHHPDLVLLDLDMPALSGTSFAQFLRRIETRPTRILIHSSLPAAELARAAQEVKAVGVLEKSSDGQRLRDAVRKHLATSALRPGGSHEHRGRATGRG